MICSPSLAREPTNTQGVNVNNEQTQARQELELATERFNVCAARGMKHAALTYAELAINAARLSDGAWNVTPTIRVEACFVGYIVTNDNFAPHSRVATDSAATAARWVHDFYLANA